jgi:hypothetical protein
MEHWVEYGGGPQDATVFLAGPASVEGFQAMSEDLARDPLVYRRGAVLLIDFSRLDASAMAPDLVEVAAEPLVEQDWIAPAAAVAYLAPDQQTQRVATLFRAFLGGSSSRRMIFSARDEALNWLRHQRASGSGAPQAARLRRPPPR